MDTQTIILFKKQQSSGFSGWLRRSSVLLQQPSAVHPSGNCLLGYRVCSRQVPWSLHQGDQDDGLDTENPELLLNSTLAYNWTKFIFCLVNLVKCC